MIPLIGGMTALACFLIGYRCGWADHRDAEDARCSHLYPAGELPGWARRATTEGDTDAL